MSEHDAFLLKQYLDATKVNLGREIDKKLSLSRTSELAGHIGDLMLMRTDDAIRHLPVLFREREPPVCTSGCTWCCYGGRIDVTAAEAAAIVSFIRNALPANVQPQLCERIAVHAQFVRENGADATWPVRTACPLLDEDARTCIVYPSRPAGCKGWTSTSVDVCEWSYKVGGENDPPVPFDEAILASSSATRTGLVEALRRAHLEATTFELSTILDAILTNPDSLEKWITGERFPETAIAMSPRAPSVEEAQRIKNRRKRARKERRR